MAKRRERKGPEFIKYFGPVLQALKENDASARPKEVYDWIISNLNIPDEELQKTNKNGQSNFENKVAFARFYLSKVDYIDGRTRGVWALTEKGRSESITPEKALQIFDDVHARFGFNKSNTKSPDQEQAPDDEEPIISGEIDHDEIINLGQIQEKITEHLHEMSSKGFEEFCARILRTIGFENVNTRGGSGDAGIDGVGELLVNRFFRTRIAFQCKKYQDSSPITPDKIRDFRGAIAGRVDRGIFLTTSRFTKAAIEEAQRDNAIPIELVDLSTIIEIMLDARIGVVERRALSILPEFFKQYR